MRERLNDYLRVLHIAKRPDRKQFVETTKLTGVGIVAIGALGLLITLLFTVLGI